MDLSYKVARVRRFSRVLGFGEAIRFELFWSVFSTVRVHVPEFGRKVTLRRGESDISVLEGVLVDRECDIALDAPRVIVDGGANIGLSTLFFAARHPGATVLAIEPSSQNMQMLKCHCAGLKNVAMLHGALWPDSGWVRIVNPDAESWAFRVEVCDSRDAGAVRAYNPADALESAGLRDEPIDLMKLDIEGAERDLFARKTDWLARTRAISIELHGDDCSIAVRRAAVEHGFSEEQRGEKLWLTRK